MKRFIFARLVDPENLCNLKKEQDELRRLVGLNANVVVYAPRNYGKTSVVKNIIIQRKKKELEPMLRVLDEISSVEGEDPETEEFTKIIRDIKLFSSKADSTLDSLVKADSNWFVGTFMKMIR